MKRIISFFFLLLLSVCLNAQTVSFPGQWYFIAEDNPEFIDPEFNDNSWSQIDVPADWEHQGFPEFDGAAWYRVHFNVEKEFRQDSLYLIVGKIDDADETYLNGKLIGKMGKFPPDDLSAWDKLRVYRIPVSMLKKNNNVLAVRVSDTGSSGGLVSGPLGIYDDRDYNKEFNPPPGAKKSFYNLVTSNGLISAVYDEKTNRIVNVRPHIFQAYDSARFVDPFVYKIKPNTVSRPRKIYYNGSTHVITTGYRSFEISYFAPFTTEEKVFYAVISGPAAKVKGLSFSFEKKKTEVLADSVIFKRKGKRLEKYFLFSFIDSLHTDKEILSKAKQRLLASGGNLLQEELSFMKNIFDKCRIPKEITPGERALLKQSISVLKMAQVSDKEVYPLSHGQVLASLPPGNWTISWVRDGVYAILGMNRLGMFDEARKALEFMLNAESGHYEHYIFSDGKDYGVGMPYKISVCRYFGTGKEESDYAGQTGPNFEFDDFGLSLIAYCDYVKQSCDTAFFRKNYGTLSKGIADVIIHLIDSNNLIRFDSGPWERHLPGKQFAYPSIVCAAGLRDFARLASKINAADAARYQASYERLMDGIKSNLLVDNRLIKGSLPVNDISAYDFFDGGTFEAFSLGLFQDRNLFYSHLKAYQKALGVKGGINGFARINKGDWYEASEWILIDLRAAAAMKRFGDIKGAKRLIGWITKQSSLNFNLIPEIYNDITSRYTGSIPMVGFGAGAYAAALLDMYPAKAPAKLNAMK